MYAVVQQFCHDTFSAAWLSEYSVLGEYMIREQKDGLSEEA